MDFILLFSICPVQHFLWVILGCRLPYGRRQKRCLYSPHLSALLFWWLHNQTLCGWQYYVEELTVVPLHWVKHMLDAVTELSHQHAGAHLGIEAGEFRMWDFSVSLQLLMVVQTPLGTYRIITLALGHWPRWSRLRPIDPKSGFEGLTSMVVGTSRRGLFSVIWSL